MIRREDDIRLRELGHLDAAGLPKRVYPTKAHAKRARKADWQRNVDQLRPYRCHVCGLWHLGHRS